MSLSQGVVLLHEPPQAFLDHMGVDLRGRDVGMAEKLLHGAQISTPLQEMAGEGVAQHMRRQTRGIEPGFEREFFQELAAAPTRQTVRGAGPERSAGERSRTSTGLSPTGT